MIPTHMPMVREDNADVVYKTEKEKLKEVAEEIKDCHERGQPVLVGSISIEKTEKISKLLKRQGVAHNVLNAKHHEKEAEIIAQAGSKGGVTISTNMAGRGTDIVLGGNAVFLALAKVGNDPEHPEYRSYLEEFQKKCTQEREEVLEAGGLHIVGTERHESRRIDNQLRGRSGRQGDPGSSRFYLSLEDDLLRIFGAERIASLMDRFGVEEDVPIEHNLVSKAIETAQRRVEGHNFDIRKHLLEYDDVMNKQREVIYEQRRQVLGEDSLQEKVSEMMDEAVEEIAYAYADANIPADEWNFDGLKEAVYRQFAFSPQLDGKASKDLNPENLYENILAEVREAYKRKGEELGEEMLRGAEKELMLRTVDALWKDHLLAMDHLKEGIGLRGYGQRNPLEEYKREGFELFEDLIGRIKEGVLEKLLRVQLVSPEDLKRLEAARQQRKWVMSRGAGDGDKKAETVKRQGKKIGRNEPCPCGSGMKYKKCCGK